MSAKTILIMSVRRESASGESDALQFEPGVNVVVGLKDTGKTSWLQTLSYVLGDTEAPTKGLGAAISTKYDTATVTMLVGSEEVVLERRWKEHGNMHKVFVNGAPVQSSEFSRVIQKLLGIPIVRFPKGNPYSGATWPELSWRMLFRHMYRQERFWADLADKQPEKEQHSCLLQFLGVASKLYPTELGEEINLRKSLLRLEARKDDFDSVFQQAARELVPDDAIRAAPTSDAINQAIARIKEEVERLRTHREIVLAGVLSNEAKRQPELVDSKLLERKVRLVNERERELLALAQVEQRRAELAHYQGTVKAELVRLKRVRSASDVFKPLSVTCCPNCDQKVSPESAAPGQCFVCRQPLLDDSTGGDAGQKRVDFELEQLVGEEAELRDILARIANEEEEIRSRLRRVDEELAEVEARLIPMRRMMSAAIPAEIPELDTQLGKLQEQSAQLHRLLQAVEQRKELSREIDDLRAKVSKLSSKLDAESGSIPFEQLSDVMSDGINEYFNHLNEGGSPRWAHAPIRLDIGERSFKIRVGTSALSTLGATSLGYVLLGYHYALLKLSGRNGFHYPGIALIDFPMTLADKTTIADKENYLVDPFVKLFADNKNIQLIVCGRSFEGLKGVHRNQLTEVWKQGQADAPHAEDIPASEEPTDSSEEREE